MCLGLACRLEPPGSENDPRALVSTWKIVGTSGFSRVTSSEITSNITSFKARIVLPQLGMECSVVIVVGETFHGEPGEEAIHG